MGILRDREERIPVTCAVLKDADRDAFFAQIRKNRAGGPEELAKWLGVPLALINSWVSGQIHIPYHTLQSIAYQFSVDMPPVGELRREALPAAQLPSTMPPQPPSEPPARAARARRPTERKPRKACAERPKPRRAQKERPPKKIPAGPKEAGPRWPKPSDALAYWAGILYAAARMDADAVSFSADRRIGQNFAGIWARKTRELFGVSCRLSMLEGGKIQEAKCEIPGLGKFLSRFCPGAGTRDKETPAPRWIWSSPGWKSAYLKGLADVSAIFQTQPAVLLDVPPNLKRAVQKLLDSLEFKAHPEKSGAVAIAGREDVERYFTSIGTENMKLRDQWASFSRGRGAHRRHEPAEAPDAPVPEPPSSSPAEPGSAPTAETAEQAPDAQARTEAKPAPGHAHRRRHAGPRRTLFRGRPDH